MYNAIAKYHKEIEGLQDIIVQDSETLLEQIDIAVLVAYPQSYLQSMAKKFHNKHMAEIKGGIKAGEKFAKSRL